MGNKGICVKNIGLRRIYGTKALIEGVKLWNFIKMERILRFSQLINDLVVIIRLHNQIENIFDLTRLSKYSRFIKFS